MTTIRKQADFRPPVAAGLRPLRSGWTGRIVIGTLVVVWVFCLWAYDHQARALWREERDQRLELTAHLLAINISQSVRQDLSNVHQMLLTWLNIRGMPNPVYRQQTINQLARQRNFASHRVMTLHPTDGWRTVAGRTDLGHRPLDRDQAEIAVERVLVVNLLDEPTERGATALVYAGIEQEDGHRTVVEVEWHLLPDTLNAENARNPLTPEELAQSVWGVRDKSGPMILPPRPGGIERSEVTMDIDVSPWPLNWQLIFRPREAWYAGEGGITRRVWLIGGIAMILSLGLLIQIEIKNKTLVHFANRTIETAALLETVLDGTEDYGIIATDLAGRMVRANRGCERLFGHPPSDLIGQSINLLSHPRAATHDKLEHILRSTLESGRYDDVVAVRGPDAEMRQVQLSCAARTDADGNPIGFVLIMHDVTSLLDRTMRLEQLNAQLAEQTQVAQRAHRLVNEFLANMSHELRTPLNAILGYTRLVHRKAGPQLEPRQSENLTKILRAGEGLLGLINDLLDLSKIQAGRMPIQCEEFKVGKVIDEVVDTIGPLAEAQRDQIVVNIDRTMLPMVTDRTHMRQILVNLMANAIKFTNKGTIEIRVRPERPTDAVRIEVIDSGVGIPEEQLNRIFEPFYQVETEGKRPDSGTGLGLSIVQRLVRHLGGEIRVDSRVGQGSVFCVTLPRDITTTQGHAAAAVHPTPQQVMPPEMGA